MFRNTQSAGGNATHGGHAAKMVSLLSLLAVMILVAGAVLPAKASPAAPASSAILVGAGDIASCASNYDTATARLIDKIPGTVFADGDEVYPSGTAAKFKDCYGPTWGRFKSRTRPVPGNHEYLVSGALGYFSYFNNIPPYYAYDLGSWRIYALNSEIDVSAAGAEVKWLKADLTAHPHQCVLAYWHEPRWSSGSTHGSNPKFQVLWQTLYEAGAELVINGHDHDYERFTEMNAYGQAVQQGLREIVAGTGGRKLYLFGQILPTSQVHDSSTHGVLELTLGPTSYSWKFIPIPGQTFTDSGTANCH